VTAPFRVFLLVLQVVAIMAGIWLGTVAWNGAS
jgi:hypothetical protein